MDWNHDGKQDWQDDFITQKIVSEKNSGSSGRRGCLTSILAVMVIIGIVAVFVLR